VSTKSPGHLIKKPGDYRRILETQLGRLGIGTVDFYHFHGVGYGSLTGTDKKGKWIKAAHLAKEEGLIRNISFSFHSDPRDVQKLVDMGFFASLLCQYNLLDRSNEEGLAYAKSKGVGTVVMGPCGGGRLTEMPRRLYRELDLPVRNSAELAFRFVFANPDVDCAISGMSSMKMVKDNAKWASDPEPLSKPELKAIHAMMTRLKKVSELYCTGCKYCLPCPAGIDIPFLFSLYNTYNVYGMKNNAKVNYQNIGKWPWIPKINALACTECGVCETKCPQKIQIRKQLKKTHSLLAKKA
jgi:predicted aldo/keto reductase-like oxidoreductase